MSLKLTKNDVWGEYDINTFTVISKGMKVAEHGDRCPIFNDILPYKSVTVVCEQHEQHEVEYWLQYVHGGGCIAQRAELTDGRIAYRSNYMCW